MLKQSKKLFFVILILFTFNSVNAQNKYLNIDLDTIKSSLIDFGKMWTFDYPPLEYWKNTYGFEASNEWLEKARLSAVKFATWCSASFVSPDGLIMTNHHCAREVALKVQKQGEDFQKNGYYAKTLADERKVPDLFVEQLIYMEDVTDKVIEAIEKETNPQAKAKAKREIIEKLEKEYKEQKGFDRAQVVQFFNGGKFSLYGYKRYNDIRLVFVPEVQFGFYGGDYDNFTYPRYDGDFSFFRAYENGKPAKITNYFKWSKKGAQENELVFTIGNPGRTNRLKTVEQLEFFRDYSYPATLNYLSTMIKAYNKYIALTGNSDGEIKEELFGISNSQKVYDNSIKYLHNPVIMARKKDFQKNFMSKYYELGLSEKDGNLWDSIKIVNDQKIKIYDRYYSLGLVCDGRRAYSDYFRIANRLYNKINKISDDSLKQIIDAIVDDIFNENRKKEHYNKIQEFLLEDAITILNKYFSGDPNFKEFTNGLTGQEAVKYILGNSQITSPNKLKLLLQSGKNSLTNDPFYKLFIAYNKEYNQLNQEMMNLIRKEDIYLNKLGIALFKVYGTNISPDATFTLRISDGIIKGYEYNGTLAPPKTTYFGLYDRYYSHAGKPDWDLPLSWKKAEKTVKLSTPFNFASTNDIIGGNSGSPIINKNLEIIGIAFDGNIENNAGDFIYEPSANRCIGVDSEGMIVALSTVYKATRLVKELRDTNK
ncbi:MAG TPA: S46 family peptidase [Ignavibacteriales bacterium]|nr:S46 family peptidase [Ignavibacteriales bacterium]HOL81063.1 S46 family peptidase [Ignavibacteriales bacterium]HPP32844.1 S46 family peptidase [Ignavibacteriales bacterium]